MDLEDDLNFAVSAVVHSEKLTEAPGLSVIESATDAAHRRGKSAAFRRLIGITQPVARWQAGRLECVQQRDRTKRRAGENGYVARRNAVSKGVPDLADDHVCLVFFRPRN